MLIRAYHSFEFQFYALNERKKKSEAWEAKTKTKVTPCSSQYSDDIIDESLGSLLYKDGAVVVK